MAQREAIESHLAALLAVDRFKDYGPNGLQVVAAQADAIVVHHGLFWRGQDGRITGWMRQRVAALLAHGINLFAYHLPLDAHPTLGNNAQLARQLGLQADARFGEQDLGFIGPAGAASVGAAAITAAGRRPSSCRVPRRIRFQAKMADRIKSPPSIISRRRGSAMRRTPTGGRRASLRSGSSALNRAMAASPGKPRAWA